MNSVLPRGHYYVVFCFFSFRHPAFGRQGVWSLKTQTMVSSCLFLNATLLSQAHNWQPFFVQLGAFHCVLAHFAKKAFAVKT